MHAGSFGSACAIVDDRNQPDVLQIGITNPTEMLHVNGGGLKIGNSTASADRALNILKFGDGNYVNIGEWEADDMLSFKSSRYNFTNGNVGIGTANPAYKLNVNGNIRTKQLFLTGGVINFSPSDNFSYDERTVGHYSLNWGTDSWNPECPTLWLSTFGGIKFLQEDCPECQSME